MTRRSAIGTDELATIIRSELNEADGGPSSELQENRRNALNYYYGRARGDELPGRSTLQSLDVADMVEAVIAQMTPALSDVNVAKFDPISEDDEQQAEIESAMVADQVYQANDGYLEIAQAVKDGTLLRTGWLKVWMEEDTDTHTTEYHDLTGETLGFAMTTTEPGETLELDSQRVTGTDEAGNELFSGTWTRRILHRRLKVEAVRAEDMAYAADWKRPTVEGCRFVAERRELERAELVELGVDEDLAYSLGPHTAPTGQSSEARATTASTQLGGHEASTELVETWDCYIRIDLDGRGEQKLCRVLFAEDQVLNQEEVPFSPYVNGWALMRPFRMDGISLYDKLATTQDGKTKALRQWDDNLYNMNNSRAGLVEGQVRISDWIASKPGGYVRMKSPDAIVPLVMNDAGPSALSFLEYQDKMRSERGGASLDLQSAEAQVAGHTAAGTDRQYTARELLASLMVRNVAETLIRGLFRLVHRTMRTHRMGELQMKRAGEWQRQDPRTWKERSRLTVNLGLTVVERARKQSTLREVIQLQLQGLQSGQEHVLVDKPGLYRAAVDLAEAGGLAAPEQYYVNPESPQAQRALQMQRQMAEEAQERTQRTRAALLQLTLGQEKYQHDTELAFNYFKELLDAEVEEAKLVGQATLDLERTQTQAAQRSGANGSGEAAQE